MKRALALVVLVACGDNSVPPAAEEMVVPGCTDIPQPGPDPFPTSESVDAVAQGPVVPGTLAHWNLDGRWFLTGVRVGGISSYHFERSGDVVIVDRDNGHPATFDDDVLFQRSVLHSNGMDFVVIKRVSNRHADGSLRAERILCNGDGCRVCTAKMIRAERNAGESEGDHISFVGELEDPAWPDSIALNVRVVDNLAYLVRRDGVHIIDVSDPAHPTSIGAWGRPSPSGSSNDVKIVQAGPKRYVLTGDVPVDIIDVTDPAHPQLAGQIAEEAHTLAVETRDNKVYAYFGNYDGKCPIYDVTDPTQPQKLGSFTTRGDLVHDLSIENGIAYLNAWNDGFYVVDYTTPSAPTLVGHWAGTPAGSSHSSWPMTVGGRHIALHGDENFNAHLDVVDVDPSSPQFMTSIGSYQTRDFISIHNLMAFGSKAYFTYYQDGVRVLEMADPTQPRLVGYFNTWDPNGEFSSNGFFEGAVGLDVDVARKLIFVADIPRGLVILKDSTP
ncbi:MAG TPA: hypothetical protein VMZ53_30235 [Kofleriaceae bacterium]|nr:hypothetical protein [Kofleriaceae bacterium]